MFSVKQKKQQQSFIDINPVESLREMSHAVNKGLDDAGKDLTRELWKQLLGVRSGDLEEGKDADLTKYALQKKTERHLEQIRPAINYREQILNVGRENPQKENAMIQEIERIIAELKRLASASKALEREVVSATGSAIVKPGKYHVNFFQSLLTTIREARMQVEDSAVWLRSMTGKRKGQGNYWKKAKDLGTSFMLSGERSVSNQTA